MTPELNEKTHRIIGAGMEVLNELGHGLVEKPYENSLTVEFDREQIPYRQQAQFEITYKGEKVGEYVPDLLVFDQVVVDTKVIDQITDHEMGQMINYLKITGRELGLILNFKYPELEWKRVAHSSD